ncbi:MAG: hypothetical protein U0324_46465 [Polyangiales bacterium]
MADPAPPAPAAPTAPASPSAPEPWGARMGWLVGGGAGIVVGFFATWAIEVFVLRGHVADPNAAAARASSALVGGGFLAGALAGHGFGGAGGARRKKLLASAVGVMAALALWATLVTTR